MWREGQCLAARRISSGCPPRNLQSCTAFAPRRIILLADHRSAPSIGPLPPLSSWMVVWTPRCTASHMATLARRKHKSRGPLATLTHMHANTAFQPLVPAHTTTH
ncbi:hypothetical protein E2C01_058905 [Portunus trituberculatus]|uniref:Uncharacterized protein n=1 Tax=Portunus trituberculatus TaxID=210409 RepID=A0A5B7H3Z9_PORTR|nr:hypothetical protein [Portunus trituberculatus]